MTGKDRQPVSNTGSFELEGERYHWSVRGTTMKVSSADRAWWSKTARVRAGKTRDELEGFAQVLVMGF